MMNYIQVVIGFVSGVVYSILGYLKNASGKDIVELDPREVIEKVLTERRELEKLEEAISIVSLIFWSKLLGEKLYFNWRRFKINIQYASHRLEVISLSLALIARIFYHYLKV